MRAALVLALLAPVAALAHAGPEGHMHPHGIEGVALALGAVAVAWFALKRAK